MPDEALFSTYDLQEIIDGRRASLRNEVETIEQNQLLNTAPSDLAAYLVDKHSLAPPVIHRDRWQASEGEVRIDVRHDRNRHVRDRSRPALVPGQRIEIDVPIEGGVDLLRARASTYTHAPPRARIDGAMLRLGFEIPHDSQERNVREEADRILDEIDRNLSWIRSDVIAFNQSLPGEAERAITARRSRILTNLGRVAALGIPLKGRANAPQTYAVPEVRRKLAPTMPSASKAPFEPEPTLVLAHYEHILSIVQSMAKVMERSPSAFRTMNEEALRQHFLVQLNGQFEGAATGETFNVSGKTDILLRSGDRNVFIAECKFWKGPKAFRETIDQLLGYTAWRDTKTAILIFNRGTAMSTILAGVKDEASRHPNHKRLDPSWARESAFRFVFHHSADKNRELLLSVLVFDVPDLDPSAPT